MIKWTFVGRGNKKSDSFHCRKESERYAGLSNMGKKEERVHDSRVSSISSCFSDRSHVMMTNMSNFQEYKKLIQEQMAYENWHHDEHFPALASSTEVPKLKNAVDSGFFCFSETKTLMMVMLMMTMLPQISLPLMMMKQLFHVRLVFHVEQVVSMEQDVDMEKL